MMPSLGTSRSLAGLSVTNLTSRAAFSMRCTLSSDSMTQPTGVRGSRVGGACARMGKRDREGKRLAMGKEKDREKESRNVKKGPRR